MRSIRVLELEIRVNFTDSLDQRKTIIILVTDNNLWEAVL